MVMKATIKFRAKVRSGGNCSIVTIPFLYIENEDLKVGSTYQFLVTEREGE